MPTLRDIRKRLKALQSTKKITAAMKMVAAAKMRKVQDRDAEFQAVCITDADSPVRPCTGIRETEIHPLLYLRPRKTVEVLILTSDKGLCGAFNTNMLIHGAIIARELGIPCVNGIADAADILGDGDLVTVDGHLGIVTVGEPEFDLERSGPGGQNA